MLELLYTSTKTLTAAPAFVSYVKSWDALVAFIGSQIFKVYRDGTQVYLGDTYALWQKGNRVEGRFFYFSYEGTAWCYAAEEITGQLHTDEVLNPSWKVPAFSGAFLDHVNRVYAKGGSGSPSHVVYLYDLDTGVSLGTIALGFYAYNLAYAGSGRLLAVNHATGDVALVDYLGQTVLWKSQVAPCVWSAYDSLHDLIITVASDQLVRVYLLTPVPATLSAPVITPAATRYGGSVVRTRLTGSAGEPCPGYLVNLAIAGSPPKGSVQKAAVKTGADGYAEHYYFGPGPGDIGEETLQAMVVV